MPCQPFSPCFQVEMTLTTQLVSEVGTRKGARPNPAPGSDQAPPLLLSGLMLVICTVRGETGSKLYSPVRAWPGGT